jgi:hypothetical protein
LLTSFRRFPFHVMSHYYYHYHHHRFRSRSHKWERTWDTWFLSLAYFTQHRDLQFCSFSWKWQFHFSFWQSVPIPCFLYPFGFWARGVTQNGRACLASSKPWVQTQVPPINKN